MGSKSSKEKKRKLTNATLAIEARHETQIHLLLQKMVASTELNKLKSFLLSQTMHRIFTIEERLQIVDTDKADGLLQICSKKFKWYDGMVIEDLFDFIRNENIEGTKEIQDEIWRQLCLYFKDPNRIVKRKQTKHINSETDSSVVKVLKIDSELKSQLADDYELRKFTSLCIGVTGIKKLEFESEDTSIQPIETNEVPHDEHICHNLQSIAVH